MLWAFRFQSENNQTEGCTAWRKMALPLPSVSFTMADISSGDASCLTACGKERVSDRSSSQRSDITNPELPFHTVLVLLAILLFDGLVPLKSLDEFSMQ